MTTSLIRSHHRDLFFLLPAQFLVYGNLFLALTIMPLYTAHLGGTAFTAGLHTAIFTGVGVILRFYFGPLADRRGRKVPLLIGSVAFATAPLLFLATLTPGSLALARAYQAIGLAAYLAASTSLLADLAPVEWRGTALTANRVIITLAFTVAPPLGEAVVRTAGFPPFFIGSAVAGLAAVGLIALVREPAPAAVPGAPPPAPSRRRPDPPDSREPNPYGLLLRDVRVLAALGASAAAALAQGGITSFLPLYMESSGAGGSGPLFLALGVGGLLAGGAGYVADRRGRFAVLIPATVLSGLAGATLFLQPNLAVLLVAGLLLGLGYTAGLAAAGTLLVDAAPARFRTTALALSETSIDGTIALGSVTLGLLVTQFGFPWAFLSLAGLCLLAALVLARVARGFRPPR